MWVDGEVAIVMPKPDAMIAFKLARGRAGSLMAIPLGDLLAHLLRRIPLRQWRGRLSRQGGGRATEKNAGG